MVPPVRPHFRFAFSYCNGAAADNTLSNTDAGDGRTTHGGGGIRASTPAVIGSTIVATAMMPDSAARWGVEQLADTAGRFRGEDGTVGGLIEGMERFKEL